MVHNLIYYICKIKQLYENVRNFKKNKNIVKNSSTASDVAGYKFYFVLNLL